VTAIDISPAALEVARRNFERHTISPERYQLLESDLLAGCDPDQPFDLILSNPPYVSQAEYQQLETTVRDYEPKQALLAGSSGCEIIQRLIEQSPAFLAEDGCLLFELSPMLVDQVRTLVGPAWRETQFVKDLAGHVRLACLRLRADSTPASHDRLSQQQPPSE
jgi:release factor glutamine methyltransferase